MVEIKKVKNLGEWLDMCFGINKFVKVLMIEYWIFKNINFLWVMGVILLIFFGVFVVLGIFLFMYYKFDVKMVFDSVNFIIM